MTMTIEIFLLGLLIASTLSGLATEAVKKLLDEHEKNYYSNTLAGIVSAVVSVLLGGGYVIYTATPVTAQAVIAIVALVLMSWLCAMVGYDKVMQAIEQFKTYGKDE